VCCVDVSQPSLGGDAEHSGGGGGAGAADRFETPPLTPLYAGDGGSHALVSTKAVKVQATYHSKCSVGSGMEIHWEETAQPETKTKPHLERRMPESRYSSLIMTFLLILILASSQALCIFIGHHVCTCTFINNCSRMIVIVTVVYKCYVDYSIETCFKTFVLSTVKILLLIQIT
jgi:hypothetical protein